ncbi:uncharacterized protein EI97DRAFT_410359 [Westerdykella ornata]|uniref:Uncharacterized protein n=1 Tax=Westerdykella ornata TaxID=318751 RepID=A0A6A6K040_WESOR|nr:uncharacterized protein EI97DRAFT_410359 [Westerdykella ornata]KAF2281488.1 hypothetical protein EI97DRAFT_410359 [Westerdykella ornata]
MEKRLANFIALSEEAVHPDTPQLRLELSGCKNLYLTLPYVITFTINRQDAFKESVILEWEPRASFAKSGFVLLHHNAAKLEAISIDRSDLDMSRDRPLVLDGHNPNLWELAPHGSVTFETTLPEAFQKVLEPGQTYSLLWPGVDISTWDYGTVPEHTDQKLTEKSPSLVLPGGAFVSFSASFKSQPWPMRRVREALVGFERANLEEQQWRAFPPKDHIECDPDAPSLSVSIQCQSTFCPDSGFEVIVKVTYQAESTARSITFHTHIFEQGDYYQLGRCCDGIWENCYQEEDYGFLIVNDPDLPLNVGQNDQFASLQPGESWTTSQRPGNSWGELPDDTEDGEVIRYVFTGGTLDWWDWGSKADHGGTVVKLPCFHFGPVVDPRDNDGRPKLDVPSSGAVEFSFSKPENRGG